MRGKLLNLPVLLLLLAGSIIFAQNKFEYDYARFYSAVDEVGYFELYYSFYQPALKTVELDGEKFTQGQLSVLIVDRQNNEKIVNKNWQFDLPVVANDPNESLTGLLRFQIDYGEYDITVEADDLNNPQFGEDYSFQLELPPLPENQLTVSDIQLASGIRQNSEDTESIFYKNTLEVTPNPSLIYGDSNPVLFFYSEIYGLQDVGYDQYTIEQKLIDFNNKVQFEKSRKIIEPFASIVEIGAVRVNDLNSGVYTLVVSVSSNQKNRIVNSAKRVYIYNKEFIDTTTSFTEVKTGVASELAMMSEDELNHIYETSKYIATEIEKEQWDKIKEVEAKRNFLTTFWEKRDPNPNTPRNEGKIAYYERVKYANQHYGNVSRSEGWKTDRGRVYITYGPPGEIERFQNEYYSKPYEIWSYYDLEGGVIFLFADEQGLNIYRMVHSTKKGEINNYREYLKYVQ